MRINWVLFSKGLIKKKKQLGIEHLVHARQALYHKATSPGIDLAKSWVGMVQCLLVVFSRL